MPVPRGRPTLAPIEIRRHLERLDGLPLRPTTARLVLGAVPDDPTAPMPEGFPTARITAATEVDPGWVIGLSRWGEALDPLRLIVASDWWSTPPGPALEALGRLWRHAVAVSQAARRLAMEAGEPEIERVARAGLLSELGLWAIGALEPEWLVEWMADADLSRRRALELRSLGTEATTIGRRLAERWGCDPLVADAAWLHADLDGSLNLSAAEPRLLSFIQQAFALAERTPWALAPAEDRDLPSTEPRLRLLMAEVQVRCSPPLVEPDANPHEEQFARSNARLRRQLARLESEKAATDRFVNAMTAASPSERPETWAERAARSWCEVPGVATARVVWTGPSPTDKGPETGVAVGNGQEPGSGAGPEFEARRAERPAPQVLTLKSRGRSCAEIHLWPEPAGRGSGPEVAALAGAWQAWAGLVAERAQLEERLDAVTRGHRGRVEQEEPRVRHAKLDALAEFAAGAGHELNNPLAVIVGRAQLLLTRATDPDSVRSLRAILGQAQRAHRILRDLMFVGRTPEPRPRFCQPEEVVRACLRDIKDEADSRGVRVWLKGGEPGPKVWADPDALRHLADALVRNALESTRDGDTIQFAVAGGLEDVRWSVKDNGRGISPTEAEHLFDPFFCGRQAGRGLGLGLPRAARIVQQAGGELRWHSTPGEGSIFHVHIPLLPPPKPPDLGAEPAPATVVSPASAREDRSTSAS